MFSRKIITVILTLFIALSINAQSAKYKRAEATFRAGGYNEAAALYKESYTHPSNDNTKKAEILFKIGECYRLISEPKKAVNSYKKAISKKYSDPIVYLYYGDCLLQLSDYETANLAYEKYNSLRPSDKRGQLGLKQCELAELWSQNPSGYLVENVRPWNSKQSDFSPAFLNSDYTKIIFTSSRDGAMGKKVSNVTGEKFTDIFQVELQRSKKWTKPEVLPEGVNSEFDEGSTAITPDGKEMYFTRCITKKKGKFGCRIYSVKYSDDEWLTPTNLKLAEDSSIVAHPSISPDGLTMFFTADIPGGYGGKDIWKVTRATESGDWGKPENLGKDINTAGNEMYPFIRDNSEFYFSSDSHEGMGGLDIFRAKKTDAGYLVENMRYPLNSSFDDFGIVFESENETGYFSSNRVGGVGSDDIYRFHLPPMRLAIAGTIIDVDTKEPLAKADVKLIGNDGSLLTTTTTEKGNFKFSLRRNTQYVVVSSLDNYLNGKAKANTMDADESKTIEVALTMKSYEKPIEIPNILYDFDKWDLRAESTSELDKLVEILNDNPNIIIELGAHTDFRGDENHNNKLSHQRAESVVNYLVNKGISKARLRSRGYGSSNAKEVDKTIAEKFNFLRMGSLLTKEYINSLQNEAQKEIAHQINRRTEFKVISADYQEVKSNRSNIPGQRSK